MLPSKLPLERRVGRFVGVVMERQLRNVREFAEAPAAIPDRDADDGEEEDEDEDNNFGDESKVRA